jgi:3-oxoacyl-[acyl-carrier-protein] synthase-3
MTISFTSKSKLAGMCSCVPASKINNLTNTTDFPLEEVRKVVAMAGVRERFVSDGTLCSSDLCVAAAKTIINDLDWDPESIGGLIMVTQSPDYFLPSTSCIVHRNLGLSDECASFDVGLGCSGFPYGIWIASMMIQSGGINKVLLLHGETPSRFSEKSDRSVSLLFGDCGSATAIEACDNHESDQWFFKLHTDGSGYEDMIIEGGGFRDRFPKDPRKYSVKMNGANIFNFTIKRVPPLIQDTLEISDLDLNDIDYFVFHQSNQFIIKHLVKKLKIPAEKVPMTLKEYGNTGGASIPLTITQGGIKRPEKRPLKLMLLGYGVGLSWGSALVDLPPDATLSHLEISPPS